MVLEACNGGIRVPLAGPPWWGLVRDSNLTVSNDKMNMECKRNGALWVTGGSMAGGGFARHGFSLYLKGPGKVKRMSIFENCG